MNLPFRNLFARSAPARLDEKASRTGALVALFSQGRPRWTPRDYSALAREGYAKNPVAFRSVRMIAEAAANVPLLLYEGAREHDEHPLLALLSRPNPRQIGADLIEQLAGYLLVSGNAYLERVCVLDDVRELHALRPDRMKVIPGAEGWAEAYEYQAGGSAVRFAMSGLPAPILHLTLFNPLDDHYGMSPLEAAQASLDVHNAASAWNKALLDNAARPSGALVYSAAGGNLSDEQFERLKAELETHYQGAANAGRPLLLEGGLDWKGLSLSPKDMDFVEAKNIAAREIALSFGVPPMLLGIPGDNTYSNYAEANRAFYRQTVVPLIARIATALGHWLGESFGGDLRIVPDLDEVPALVIEREALWARIGAAGFLTDDEKRAAAGYEPLPAQSLAPSSLTTLLAKYSPDQPRVPAGNSDGGQWTSGGGGGAAADDEGERGDQDLLPANAVPNARRREPRRISRFGKLFEIPSADEARVQVAENRANNAMEKVREYDPEWKPKLGLWETVDGYILELNDHAKQAEVRFVELQDQGVAPGRFAAESIPARGPERNFTLWERVEIDRIGLATGCHTCGTFDPETTSGHFVIDHQKPSALNKNGRAQRLYPQCLRCSWRQGGHVGGLKW
ncbi:MAG: phage portal protein [Rhizobiales bacterium]|nr:phage portal protein [Hyphomicrobiales bacterium]